MASTTHLLHDPCSLGVPVATAAAALPHLVEPVVLPSALAATANDEALVAVAGERILVLPAYATEGWPAAAPVQLLRAETLTRLQSASLVLPDGFGLVVLDAWRPLELQAELYAAAYADGELAAGFVSAPSDSAATPPPHLTGGTVDLTLSWEGVPLALGTDFDDFTALACSAAFESVPGRVRDLRRLLWHAMHEHGFVVLDGEWWHYEFGTPRWAAITGNAVRYGATSPTL